ncbi:hypothetical protein JHK82_034059 [Glycine max]|nr:hypothetical protein JHK85_034767 [Glycine max]KAG4986438.1 hypothetical protein JHK86_034129 [Glycine max]KAG5119639.1 hypothetical protein JHK82_034059 [Glycine max]
MAEIVECTSSSFTFEKEKFELTLVSPFSSRLGLSYAPEGGLMSMMYGGGKLAEGLTKLVIFVTDTFLIRDLCRPLMSILPSLLVHQMHLWVKHKDDVFQLAQLASKVVKDPKLTVDQLEKLLVKSSILEDAQKSKAKLNYRLVSTTNSIPSLVEEIQLGFSRRAKWEMDKGNEFGDDFDRNISSFVVFHWIFYIGTPQWDNNLSFVCFDFL